MAERKLSSRSERRLRLKIARHVAGECLAGSSAKRQRAASEIGDFETESDARSVNTSSMGVGGKGYESCDEPNQIADEDQYCSYNSSLSDAELSDSYGEPSDQLAAEDQDCYSSDYNDSDLSDVSSDIDSALSDLSDAENEVMPLLVQRVLPLENALFPCSPVATREFNVGFMMLCQRHNLPYVCQDDILKLMSITHPTPNKVPRSSHLLLKQFVNFKEECSLQHFCGNCLSPIVQGSSCLNLNCTVKSPNAVFIHVPLIQQLAERMQGNVGVYVYV